MKSTYAGWFCCERREDWRCSFARDRILVEDLVNLLRLILGPRHHFGLLPLQFGGIMFGVAARSQVSAQAHRDRSGRDFCQAGEYDNVRARYRAGQTGRQRKRDSKSVREANHNVANRFAGLEVSFNVC